MEPEYRERLRAAILAEHECESLHTATMRVLLAKNGETEWEGEVEVFDISGHHHAKKCYAWGAVDGEGRFTAMCVLEISPVHSPATAVETVLARRAFANKQSEA